MVTDAGPARLLLRVARAEDEAALRAMYRRCSPRSRYHRFHGRMRELPDRYLTEALAGDPVVHDAIVGEDQGGDIVTLASARSVAVAGVPTAELGLLVEDSWQRRGVGTALLEELVDRACHRGVRAISAQILVEDAWLLRMLARTLGPAQVTLDGAVSARWSLGRVDDTRTACVGACHDGFAEQVEKLSRLSRLGWWMTVSPPARAGRVGRPAGSSPAGGTAGSAAAPGCRPDPGRCGVPPRRTPA